MTARAELSETGKKPVRTCVGCKARAVKSSLLRLVVVGNGIVPDPRARQPGRGAYVHPSLACFELAQRRKAFPRALRVSGSLDTAPVISYLSGPKPGHNMADGDGTERYAAAGGTLDTTENLYGKQVEKL